MKFQGFIGPSYKLKSVNVDCQRCVNLYPEVIESATGKESQVLYLKSTPGLNKIFELGDGPIRLIHVDSVHRIFVVSGNEVYRFDNVGGEWIEDLLGTLDTSTGKVSAASAVIGEVGSQEWYTVFVDGENSYLSWEGDVIFPSFGNYASFGYPPVTDSTHVVFIDGYFIFNQKDTGKFLVSDLNTFGVDPLSFATSEGDPDNVVSVVAVNRELWLLNERSTEVFYNSGNADFPFERISGGFIEKGCVAPYSANKIDGTVLWLGRDEAGQGTVYAAKGFSPQRISTHAIEYAIGTYEDMTVATSYTYQQDGHSFYVLNFPEATWVYDLSTKLWHERAYTNDGALERHRVDCVGFYSRSVFGDNYNIHLAGDYENNKIYLLDNSKYTDDGDTLTRLRVSPHASNGLKNVFYNHLQIDVETGVGLDGTGQGTDPQAMMRFSNDGGHTWSNELMASIGKIGQYKNRLIWRRLGRSRDRVFEIKITDPVPVTLLSAELEVEAGAS